MTPTTKNEKNKCCEKCLNFGGGCSGNDFGREDCPCHTIHSKTPTKNEIREEWNKCRHSMRGMKGHIPCCIYCNKTLDEMFEWTISKLDHLLEAKIKAIEGKKRAVFSGFDDIHNQALDLAISILREQ